MISGCPGDQDGGATPYSWLNATELSQLPGRIDVYLCEDVPEWYAVDLQAGEALEVVLERASPESVSVDLHKPPATPDGDAEYFANGSVSTSSPQRTLTAVTDAGRYYIEVEQWNITGSIALSIGTTFGPGPTARAVAVQATRPVYAAVCARLHGDCATSCDSAGLFCGATVDDCADRLADAAVEDRPDAVNAGASQACIAALPASTCSDLALIPSCGGFVNEACDGDGLAFARPSTAQTARPIAPGDGVPLLGCDRRSWWYTLPLAAGEHVEIDWPTSTYLRAELFGDPEARAIDVDSDYDGDPLVLDPAPMAGTYYLELSADIDGVATVRTVQ